MIICQNDDLDLFSGYLYLSRLFYYWFKPGDIPPSKLCLALIALQDLYGTFRIGKGSPKKNAKENERT